MGAVNCRLTRAVATLCDLAVTVVASRTSKGEDWGLYSLDFRVHVIIIDRLKCKWQVILFLLRYMNLTLH